MEFESIDTNTVIKSPSLFRGRRLGPPLITGLLGILSLARSRALSLSLCLSLSLSLPLSPSLSGPGAPVGDDPGMSDI
jgi:hypothetical protein